MALFRDRLTCMEMSVSPPSDLGASGIDVWNELVYERELGAVHMSLIHNCARLVDNLDAFAREFAGEMVVTNDLGEQVANPLLVEFRQQFLALRQVLKDLGLMKLPDSTAGVESALDRWAKARGLA